MVEVLLFFIGTALLLYIVLGGADYGSGIIEILPIPKALRRKQTAVINQAMGPVWEANHIWLILIIVILFMGFPPVFNILMISFHLPMVALLIGVVVRGCSFAFRHYDPQITDRSHRVYTWIFGLSSIWTSFWLGVIVASLHRGLISTEPTDFWTDYVLPWAGFYPFATGIFVVLLFLLLANAYLIGETKNPDLTWLYRRRLKKVNFFVIVAGAIVFAGSCLEQKPILSSFLQHPLALLAVVAATLCFWELNRATAARSIGRIRTFAALQVSFILLGWLLIYAPNAITTAESPLSFYAAAAPAATLQQLVIALLVGSVLIFPSLFYLIRVFKLEPEQ